VRPVDSASCTARLPSCHQRKTYMHRYRNNRWLTTPSPFNGLTQMVGGTDISHSSTASISGLWPWNQATLATHSTASSRSAICNNILCMMPSRIRGQPRTAQIPFRRGYGVGAVAPTSISRPTARPLSSAYEIRTKCVTFGSMLSA